ncbi:ABC transporter substrate-binding protein [Halorussus sp. AFM4]|uniref:ABC transporter substrate-binding protein n=1 Tax=Halorussus sp. AFM4 TaxID=3421651 RepID=UPI003EB8F1D0
MPTRRECITTAGAGITLAMAGCTGSDGTGSNKNTKQKDVDTQAKSQSNNGKPMEIMIAWSGGDGAKAFDAVHKGFQEQYPNVNTKINNNPGGAGTGLATALDTRMFNENPPSTWGFFTGPMLQPYVEAGLMGSITEEVWQKEGLEKVVPDYLQDMCRFENTGYVAVPLEFNRLNNLFYNTSIVEQAGVDPTSLKSPSDLVGAMEKVEQNTDAVGMAQSTKSAWTVMQLWESIYVGENGYDSYQSFLNGNIKENEQQIKTALQVLKDYRPHFTEDAASINFSEAISTFVAKDAAFLNQGAWAVGNFSRAKNYEYQSDWKATPIPGSNDVFMGQNSGFMYPTPNPTPKSTVKWLRYCGSVEAQTRFNAIKGGIPCRNDIKMDGSGEYTFNGYQKSQYQSFKNAKNLTGTIAHNNEVVPEVASNVSGVFSTFAGNWNVNQAYKSLVKAFDV